MNKQLLRSLISEGNTKQVLEYLKTLLPQLSADLEKAIIMQLGQFEYYHSLKLRNSLTAEDQERELTKINQALLAIIDKIPASILPEQDPEMAQSRTSGQSYGHLGPASSVSSNAYGWASLVAFLIGAVFMALFALFGRALVGTGLEGRLYFIILIPCALATAAFLFGFMRSYATFSGNVLDRKVELGGPIVGALLVVLGGHYLVPGKTDFNANVHLTGHHAERAIATGGSVKLNHSSGYEILPIDDYGYVTFKKVPADRVSFELIIDGYELAEPGKEYLLDKEQLIDLPVKMKDIYGKVRGVVTDLHSGTAVANAFVQINTPASTFETYTNTQGTFFIDIPDRDRAEQYHILVKKSGYLSDENDWYSGDSRPLDIRLRSEFN